jgi:nucleotide-binding universal stress UspA family protein
MFNARLILLHVVDDLALVSAGIDGYVGAYPDLQRDAERDARGRLEELVRPEDVRALGAESILLKASAPAVAIVDYAKEAAIDLIVMGTHGRGPITHLLMGSVAERVVRTAPCPVLTVKHPEHEAVLADALARIATA